MKRKREATGDSEGDTVLVRVRKQLEHYMSDAKLLLDNKLRAASAARQDRGVPVRLLARRQRIRGSGGDGVPIDHVISLIREAAAKSTQLRWLEGGSGILVPTQAHPEIRKLVVKAMCPKAARLAPVIAGPECHTVMSYNLLAEHLATPRMFSHVEPKALSWEYRSAVIQREIKFYSPSLLCLQEVQSHPDSPEADHATIYQEWLRGLGMDTAYMRKTPVKGLSLGGAQIGNMVAWDKAKFKMVEEFRISLARELHVSLKDLPRLNTRLC